MVYLLYLIQNLLALVKIQKSMNYLGKGVNCAGKGVNYVGNEIKLNLFSQSMLLGCLQKSLGYHHWASEVTRGVQSRFRVIYVYMYSASSFENN